MTGLLSSSFGSVVDPPKMQTPVSAVQMAAAPWTGVMAVSSLTVLSLLSTSTLFVDYIPAPSNVHPAEEPDRVVSIGHGR